MTLYVDETENNEYFIVAGLLLDSKADAELAYKRFKNKIKNYKISDKAKARLYTEFKSTIMDRNYQKHKTKMLECIVEMNCSIFYSYYKKTSPNINQSLKESVYITLLSTIISEINKDTHIIFDGFGIGSFEQAIISSCESQPCILKAEPGDSQKVMGLQFVDNICSAIRRHISTSEEDLYYHIICDRTVNTRSI